MMIAPGAPTLTAKTAPQPGVEVYFPTLDAGVDKITVWRVADGTREAVAGALKTSASGDFVVTDWQVPFGVVATYVGEVFDIVGASLLGATSNIIIACNDVWFSSQVDPSLSFTVNLEKVAFSEVSRQRRTQQVWVAGASLPFEQDWGIGGITGLPFTVYTESETQASAMDVLLQSSPLLIRTPPTFFDLPRSLSASIKQPKHTPFDLAKGGTTIVWTLTVDEVQPFSKAIVRPLVTWDDWTAAFPSGSFTWDDVKAVYGAGTWTDAKRTGP